MGKHFSDDRLATLVALLRPARRTRVVEVGANPINDNPYGALLAAGHCDVWGFEPEDAAFARLTDTERATFLPYAIGDGSAGALNVCKVVSLSSLLKPNARTTTFFQRLSRPMRVMQRLPVQTRRLDDLEEVPEFDLLKIDVQGGEIQVFEGARARLADVAAVITEVAFVPLYEDQPLIDAQIAELRKSDLDLHKFDFLKSFSLRGGLNTGLRKTGHANQLLDGDAVFLRSLRYPEKIPSEKLKHMAILCDAVLESFDITVRCLDLLIERGAIAREDAMAYVAQVPDT